MLLWILGNILINQFSCKYTRGLYKAKWTTKVFNETAVYATACSSSGTADTAITVTTAITVGEKCMHYASAIFVINNPIYLWVFLWTPHRAIYLYMLLPINVKLLNVCISVILDIFLYIMTIRYFFFTSWYWGKSFYIFLRSPSISNKCYGDDKWFMLFNI